MKKIVLVDEIEIGKFRFQAYIVDKMNDKMAFSIYDSAIDEPVIEMIADEFQNVEIVFNKKHLDFINNNKTDDIKLRRMYYKIFIQFLLEAEKKASYMIFKGKKLNYIKNAKDIIDFRSRYIYSKPSDR